MIRLLLQFLAILLLFRFVFRAVAQFLSASPPKSVEGSPWRDKPLYRGRMVRDPVCGVYIPEQTAIAEREGGQVYHFCSESCRETFRRSRAAAR